MERSHLAAVLLGVLAIAVGFPGAAAAAAVGTQPGAMAKASREPATHVSLSCAPTSSFAVAGRTPADTVISVGPLSALPRGMLPAREAPSTEKPPPQLGGVDAFAISPSAPTCNMPLSPASDRLAAVSGGAEIPTGSTATSLPPSPPATPRREQPGPAAPALPLEREYAGLPAAVRRFLREEVCDAEQLAEEVVGSCPDNVPDLACCRAIIVVVDTDGCFCEVSESPIISSNGMTPSMILTLYVDCHGTKNVSTLLDHCGEASSPPPPPPPPTPPPPSRSDAPPAPPATPTPGRPSLSTAKLAAIVIVVVVIFFGTLVAFACWISKRRAYRVGNERVQTARVEQESTPPSHSVEMTSLPLPPPPPPVAEDGEEEYVALLMRRARLSLAKKR